MPVPRSLAAVILLSTVGAAVWLARDETVTRYYMPGPLGEQRIQWTGDRRKSGEPESQRAGLAAEGLAKEGRPERQKAGEPDHQSEPPVRHRLSGSPGLRLSGLPAYLTRHIGLRAGVEQQWGTRNGLTAGIAFSHHLDRVFPRELYDTHPEFFPLVGGKRFQPAKGSYYWNPDLGRADVAAYAAGVARKHFEQHPSAVSFALGVNDGLIFGESPETLEHVLPPRWFRGRPDYTNLVYTFMNRAAEDLSRTHPDKYLGALAYYWAENAPSFRVHPQVIPFLTADRAQSYDPAFKAEELELQRRWAAAMGLHPAAFEIRDLRSEIPDPSQISNFKSQIPSRSRLGLYDYLDGYGFLIPRVPIRAFAEHLRHARSVGFTDYYGEAPVNWGVNGPLHWVIAQVLSRPDAEVEALLDEYYREYFREAATPMRQFFERCEQIWMQQSGPSYWLKYYRSEAQADLFPSAVCAELRRMLDGAAQAATSSVVRDRVRFVSDSFGLTERFVAFQEARAALAEAVLKSGDGRQGTGDSGQGTGDRGQGAVGKAEKLKTEKLKSAEISASQDISVSASGSGHFSVSASQRFSILPLLSEYLTRRSEFIRYSLELRRTQPLAFYPLNHDDWLRNDPTFAAARRLIRDGGSLARESEHQVLETLASLAHYPAVAAALSIRPETKFKERLTTGNLNGPIKPGQRIAGLPFGIDLPAPWQSRVEPTEHGRHETVDSGQETGDRRNTTGDSGPTFARALRRARQETGDRGQGMGGVAEKLKAETLKPQDERQFATAAQSQISNLKSQIPPQAGRILRISGAENTTMFQWLPAQTGALYIASVQTRGRVSSSNATMITLGWLDAKQQPIGKPVVMRLPDGTWDEWVTLEQAQKAPANAAWVGIGLRIQHQLPGDWGEFRQFSLLEAE